MVTACLRSFLAPLVVPLAGRPMQPQFGARTLGRVSNAQRLSMLTFLAAVPSRRLSLAPAIMRTPMRASMRAPMQRTAMQQAGGEEDVLMRPGGEEGMRLEALATTLRAVEAEAARLERVSLLTELLEDALRDAPEDLLSCLALTTMQLLPSARPLKLGVGESLVLQALESACGQPADQLKAALLSEGDIGALAERVLAENATASGAEAREGAPLRVRDVHAQLLELTKISGSGAVQRKVDLLGEMLRRASPAEGLLIVRIVRGQLRSGLGAKGLRDALAAAASAVGAPEPAVAAAEDEAVAAAARASVAEAAEQAAAAQPDTEKKEMAALGKAARAAKREAARARKAADALRSASRRRAAALVSDAYSVQPCYHALVSAVLEHGVWGLATAQMVRSGTPIQPMTASPVSSVEGATERLPVFPILCEWKYDGERCQAHLLPRAKEEDGGEEPGSRVRLFSRSLDEVSVRFPEIVESLPAAFGASAAATEAAVESAVLDCEICAVNDTSGSVLPFQGLAARPRKAPTAEQLAAGPGVCVFAFDLLELNGRSLLSEPLAARRETLRRVLTPIENRVDFAEGVEVDSEEGLRNALELSVDAQAEGLMLKALAPQEGSVYEPGKRSLQWLKLKKDYIDGLGDSFDLVPIGAYRGRGKRAGMYGAYLLAVYEPTARSWQPICKIGTGFSDEQLARWSELAPSGEEDTAALSLDLGEGLPPNLEPHVWLPPSVVWEVSAASVSVSPTYRAAFGRVDEDKGLALRFPRLVRERPDKQPTDATTAAQLVDAYMRQSQTGNNAVSPDDQLE